MATELAVLEGTVPSTKELLDLRTKMADMDKALLELDKGMNNLKRGMEFVIEQADQLEQSLQVDPAQQPFPYPPP
eukprot:12926118-Prorocentrum_lima.AAC.1